MSAYSSVLGVVVLLLHLWTTHSFPTSQACPVPCLCQRGPLLNCSSLGLTETPVRIPTTAVSLNISHNALRSLAPLSSGHVKLKGLLHLWVGSNSLESLDLDLKKNVSSTRTLSSGEQKCVAWAPDLQLLSAERNHLKHLPTGLRCLKSLQILHLSYNQISAIGPFDLTNSTSLKELHLQHNHIRSIHSHAFTDLKQLEVLDLSYNLLATIPVHAYQSLRSLNALVNISFNRWKCDCNLKTLRRWISFDTEVGDDSWKVVCDSPSHHAGKDLLHLKDSDLTCPTHEYSTYGHYHNMIVDEGTQILISCRNDSQDSMQVQWWTPYGQVRDNQPQLLIKDITEQHEGLYICVSGHLGEHISVFDLQVYTIGSDPRRRREAPIIQDEHLEQENTNVPRNNPSVRQGTRTQSEFVLAVCLSVFITFIVAFILGVLLRPLLDKLCTRIRSKRHPSPSLTTSRALSTGHQPYVNEGYSDAGDQEQVLRVGSRVTFGEITEVGDQGGNVPYYVTVEDVHSDGSSESNTEVENVYEDAEKNESSEWREQAFEMDHHRGRANSSSSSSTQEGKVNVLVMNNKTVALNSNTVLEFEPIPDGDDITQPSRRSSKSSSSSSSASSSHSRSTMDINFSSKVKESTELSVDTPAVTVSVTKTTTEGKFPEFTKESGWPASFTEQNVDDLDTEFWNDSGESFSFNEESERDLCSSALGHPVDDDDTWRKGKIESPTYKLNFNSQLVEVDIPFGKEVSVDDVKPRDTLSSSSSSESDDSEGPNSYTVNPELQEESEILKESFRKTDSDWTLEDSTFDEKSHPGAGSFIRQETITLDPSDIHLTFTREESDDEGKHIDDSQKISEGVFGSWKNVSVDTVPKVKRYVQFKQSKPQSPSLPSLSPSSTKKNVTPEIEVKTEAKLDSSPGEASFVTQVKVSFEEIPKVKRYIHFKQSEPHSPILPPSPSSTNKDVNVEARRSSTSSSGDEGKLTYEEEKFFRKADVSFDGVPKVKRYITFKQFEPSPNLSVFSPPDISGNIPQTDQRNPSNFSPEGLPLYHVHPSYRINQSTLNRDHDTDRSSSKSSSEDEDQFLAYPRKLEIKTEPDRESIAAGKNTDTVLNIDFDNSSSSTDVFEKKNHKGLARLKLLSTRLFNRHENETGEAPDLSYKMHSKLTEDTVQQTEDSFFGDIGLSSDQLKRPTKSLAFTISDPQSPDQLSPYPTDKRGNTHEERAEFESRRFSSSSSSEEENFSEEHEDDIIFTNGLSHDHLPKVKRYLQFSHSGPHSQTQLPSPPSTTEVVTADLIAKTESRRSSSSSEDDVKQSTDGENFYGLPKVKRYIEFSYTEPTINQLNKQSVPPKIVAPPVYRRSSSTSSSEEVIETSSSTPVKSNVKSDLKEDNFFGQIGMCLDTVPKVKQYVEFTQSKPPFSNQPSLSPSSTKKNVTPEREVKTEAKVDSSPGEISYSTQAKVSVEGIPKVKRYIHFKQSEPHSPALPPPHSSTNKDVRVEARRLSTSSSEDEAKLTSEEERKIDVSSDGVSKVKRYIAFKQLEPASPTLSVSSASTKTEVTTGAVIKSSESSSSSEDEVSPTPKENEFLGKIGVSLDRLPQVKRYLQFKQRVRHLPVVPPTTTLNTLLVTPANITKVESRKLSPSSEDDDVLTAQEDNFVGQTGASLDRIPKVKRYIHFTQPKSQSPAPLTTSQRVSKSVVVHKTRKSSTSSDDEAEVVLSRNDDMTEETGESFVKIPKVKRYVKFTRSEDSLGLSPVKSIKATETKLSKIDIQPATSENTTDSRRLSTSSEDDVMITSKKGNFRGQTGIYLDKIPTVRRYIHFTHQEQHSPSQSTTSQSVGISTRIQETRRSSTSSEEDVKVSTNYDMSYRQMGASFSQPPQVKRYIEFKQHESSFPDNSFPVEDNKLNTTLNRLSMTSMKAYSAPKAKADLQTRWSSSSSDASPPGSIRKGSALVIKSGSDSLRSDLRYKDIITTTQSIVEQTGLKPELKTSGYFSSDSRDLAPPQNNPPAVPQTPPPSYLEQEDAREYLRDNSEVRQRQERRRLLQQRRKAMDELGITSPSSITQEGKRQDSGSRMNFGGATLSHSENARSTAPTANTVTYRRTEVAEVTVLQGLKTKNISTRRSKSPEDSANTKYKEFLI